MGCMWDRDTLKEEGKGRMEAVKVIVGWFDRYPPEYYEARLERVLEELKTKPEDLSLYDDAGVALDRLHRSDEAIVIMARKKAVMTKLEGEASAETLWEHQYRYLANLGTFYVHRWIGREKEIRNADLSDLVKAEELIASAIEHNPDAHFGREKYQLLAIQWLQKVPKGDGFRGPLGDVYEVEETEEALEGFLGMINLGSAWESTDFFNTVGGLLMAEKRAVLALAAVLRVEELQKTGRGSIHPHESEIGFYIRSQAVSGYQKDVEPWFQRARQAADERQESRWTYLRKGLAEGRHPDTDPDFWKGWNEPKFPSLPGLSPLQFISSPEGITLALITAVILLITLWIISALRRIRKKRRLESIKVVGLHS